MFRVSVALLAALPASFVFITCASAQHQKGAHAPAVVYSRPSPPALTTPSPRFTVVRPDTAVIFVPIRRPAFTGPQLSLAPDPPRSAPVAPRITRRTAISPLSVNPIDPATVVSRTPSGRVVLSSLRSGAAHHGHRHQARGHMPYAPPSFQIIGSAAGRHMSQPVRLTHGAKPRRGLRTEPQVVFLKAAD
jgi:hypothetical protein